MWAALRTWKLWKEACLPEAPHPPGPIQRVVLEEFIHASGAATGPAATYNKAMWLIRHLHAPLVLVDIKKPRGRRQRTASSRMWRRRRRSHRVFSLR